MASPFPYYYTMMMMLLMIIMVGSVSAATNRFPFDTYEKSSSATNNNNNNNPKSNAHDMIKLSMSARYEQWMAKHGRVYKDAAEKELRFKIFQQNVEYIESFNRAGGHKYKLGVNKFSDLSSDEFKAYHTGLRRKSNTNGPNHRNPTVSTFMYENMTDVPDSLDWRMQDAVTPIKDQGSCACCWAFSAVAAIEGINQISTGNLISLSEQQVVDCDVNGNDNGCGGGLPDNAFKFIINSGGLMTEDNYPYQGGQSTCKADTSSSAAATISGYNDVLLNSESSILQAVAQQPISIGIDGGDPHFQNYESGVFTGPCGTHLDHAVTIIGYGTDTDGTKYWLIKNQWGTSWGEGGYMRILRDSDAPEGVCGLAMQPSYPTL